MNDREIVFWTTVKNDEFLSESEKDVAIEHRLERFEPGEWPLTIEVYGFARMVVLPEDCGSPLENVLENLDEEFGNPDGAYTAPTEKMKAAELEFKKVVIAEYTPWACEQVTTETVNAMDWIRENRPEWLDGGTTA